ncbi:MAG: hypothetical protein AAGG48_30540 [Planctomycetota bacterium]
MNFSLRAIFKIVLVAALLFAVTAKYPPIGVFCSSFLPLPAVVLLRKRLLAASRRKWVARILAYSLAVTPIYVASLGPYWMMATYLTSYNVELFWIWKVKYIYRPLIPVCEIPAFASALDWYVIELRRLRSVASAKR